VPVKPGPRRSWLFVPGADERAHAAAARCGADVVILELEDFTPPPRRDEARAMTAGLFARWRAVGETHAEIEGRILPRPRLAQIGGGIQCARPLSQQDEPDAGRNLS